MRAGGPAIIPSTLTEPGLAADHRATTPIQHGGNQAAIRARLGLGDHPLLDFSAPLNGLGPPPGALAAVRAAVGTIDRYPEPGSPRLVRRLAEFHGVPAECIFVAAGTTEHISLIGQVLRDSLAHRARNLGDPDVAVSHLVEPSYGEYRRASAQNGLTTRVWDDHVLGWEQDVLPEADFGIFWTGHPNNPTARAWDRDRLLGLIDRSPDLLTVVDEAYLPFLPDEADRTLVGSAATRDNVVVLRSMTKIYAFPGLRIGYAVTSPDLVARLRRFQQPWTVSTAAEAAAIAALDDDEYLERTIEFIGSECARLTDLLWDVPGLRPCWPSRRRPESAPPPPNFILVSLVETPWTSPRLQDALARRGLFVRECSNYRGLEPDALVTGPGLAFEARGHLRVCVRSRPENNRLVAMLEELMASEPED